MLAAARTSQKWALAARREWREERFSPLYTKETAGGRREAGRFRVGVNSGEALVGVLGATGGRSYSVIGDAVNSASRLESAAPVGEVAIGAVTLRALSGARTRALGAIKVKGRRGPLDAYVLESLPPDSG